MRLALGTAQFGLSYGVSNASGKTSYDEACRILSRAAAAGIEMLDTAAAYGDSEQVLGRIGVRNCWQVVSKVPPLPEDGANGKDWVLRHVRQSLSRLNVGKLDGLLVHRATDLLGTEGRNVAAGFKEAKDSGMVSEIGFSIYSPHDLAELVVTMPPDLVQAPFNVVDQRLVLSGWLDTLVASGVKVHVRSIFMQGLLLMDRGSRPSVFQEWDPIWRRWDAAVGSSQDRALSLCIGFVKSYSKLSRIIVGTESTAHLENILNIWEAAAPFDAADLACGDERLVDPSNWKLS